MQHHTDGASLAEAAMQDVSVHCIKPDFAFCAAVLHASLVLVLVLLHRGRGA